MRPRPGHVPDLALIAAGGALGLLLAAMLSIRPAVAQTQPGSGCRCAPLTDVSDLPLVEMPVTGIPRTLAVLVSGDGGWRAIDRKVAEGLNARGVPVVGLVSPKYFSERRTPEEAACALERIIAAYGPRWHVRDVLVAGYSRGAGVAPFMVNRMAPAWRARVKVLALIGLEPTIAFEVTPFDLLRTEPAPAEVPVRGEIERLRGRQRVLCFYGDREDDSLCRQLGPSFALKFREPGGHHFAGNYDSLAAEILRWAHA